MMRAFYTHFQSPSSVFPILHSTLGSALQQGFRRTLVFCTTCSEVLEFKGSVRVSRFLGELFLA